MTEALQQEIRTLRSLLDSPRDPAGRVFAPLADAYRRAGKIPDALRLLNQGLAKHPDFATAHVVAARIYVEQGLGTEGALAARRALELDGENVLALRSLLRVLDETGDAEAGEVRGRLLALEPDFTPDWAAAAPTAETAAADAPSPDAPTVPVKALGRSAAPVVEIEAEEPSRPEVWADDSKASETAIEFEPLPVSDLSLDPGLPSATALQGLGLELPEAGPFSLDAPAAEPPSELAASPPDTVVDEPIMDLPMLAPEPAVGEPVLDLGTLAPEPAVEESVMDLGALTPDEEVMSLDALAPDAAVDEPVMDLGALAPDEEVMSLDALAPDAAVDEPVMDLAALAPDEGVMSLDALAPDMVADEPVMDLAALAPDEEVMSLDALAPDVVADEPVMELAALAPDEEVMSLDALAPDATSDEPVMDLAELAPAPVEEPVMDLAALAPDEEVMSLDALAPDVVAEEPVMDLGALAPDDEVMSLDALAPDAVADEPVTDLAALAPDAVPDEPVTDLDALAPAVSAQPTAPTEAPSKGLDFYDEPIFDLDTLAPVAGTAAAGFATSEPRPAETVDVQPASQAAVNDVVIDMDALKQAPEPGPSPSSGAGTSAAQDAPEALTETAAEDEGRPVFTRTLAELYAKQGATRQAVEVLRHLQSQSPGDSGIARRIAELEAAAPTPEIDTSSDEDDEVETLARDLAESGIGRHEVDSPFAWADKEPDQPPASEGPTIREYFDGLLDWEPREGA